MEIFGAGAAGIEKNVVSGMAFLRIRLRRIGRHEFCRIPRMDASRICLGGSRGHLMVFHLFTVLHSFFLGFLGSQRRRGRCLHEMIVFIVFRMVGILDSEGDIRIRVIREAIFIGILESRENGIGIHSDCLCTLLAISFMVGTADGHAVCMICQNDDQGIIAMLFGPVFRIFDGFIKFDGIVSRTLPVHDMELLIDGSTFDHCEETIRILGEDIQCFLCHVHQVRLVREALQHLRILLHFTIDVNIHRAGMEEAEERLVCRRLHEVGRVIDEGIALVFEFFDDIHLVFSLRTGYILRDVASRAAAQDDIWSMVVFEVVLREEILRRSSSGVTDHRCRGRIGGFRLCDKTDGHAAGTFQDLRDIFYLRIIERIFGGVFVNAHGIDDRLVTCCISGSGVCTVGDEGVIAGRGDDCIVRELFHREQVIVLAIRHALGKNAGHFTRLQRHAVADEEDDILCFLLCDFMHHLIGSSRLGNAETVLCGSCDFHLTRLRKGHVIDTERGDAITKILHCRFLAEELFSRNAVDRHVDILKVFRIGNFDIKVETCAAPEFCGIYRKNANIRCLCLKDAPQNGTAGQKTENCCFHDMFSHYFLL